MERTGTTEDERTPSMRRVPGEEVHTNWIPFVGGFGVENSTVDSPRQLQSLMYTAVNSRAQLWAGTREYIDMYLNVPQNTYIAPPAHMFNLGMKKLMFHVEFLFHRMRFLEQNYVAFEKTRDEKIDGLGLHLNELIESLSNIQKNVVEMTDAFRREIAAINGRVSQGLMRPNASDRSFGRGETISPQISFFVNRMVQEAVLSTKEELLRLRGEIDGLRVETNQMREIQEKHEVDIEDLFDAISGGSDSGATPLENGGDGSRAQGNGERPESSTGRSRFSGDDQSESDENEVDRLYSGDFFSEDDDDDDNGRGRGEKHTCDYLFFTLVTMTIVFSLVGQCMISSSVRTFFLACINYLVSAIVFSAEKQWEIFLETHEKLANVSDMGALMFYSREYGYM